MKKRKTVYKENKRLRKMIDEVCVCSKMTDDKLASGNDNKQLTGYESEIA